MNCNMMAHGPPLVDIPTKIPDLKLRRDRYETKLRWTDVHEANLKLLRDADVDLAGRSVNFPDKYEGRSGTFHQIIKHLFGETCNIPVLLRLLGSQKWKDAGFDQPAASDAPMDTSGPWWHCLSQGNIASTTAQLNNVTAELASMHMQIRAEKESAAAYQRDADTVRQALAVLSAEVKTYEAASPAPSTAQKMSTINILKQKNKTRKRVFMRQVKAQIDADIREPARPVRAPRMVRGLLLPRRGLRRVCRAE